MFDLNDEIFKFNRGRNCIDDPALSNLSAGLASDTPEPDQSPKNDPLQPQLNGLANGASNNGDLAIFEYREPSKQGNQYCPVYAGGRTNAGGICYYAYISGEITEVDTYISLIDTLVTMEASDQMVIYIDSPGGYVASGGLIASAIDDCAGTVLTIARGFCASAAALIHSAAKPGNSQVSAFAVMLYHMSSHMDQGVSTNILNNAKRQVKYVNETLLSKALKDGHITEEEFARIQQGENVLVPAAVWNARTHKEEE